MTYKPLLQALKGRLIFNKATNNTGQVYMQKEIMNKNRLPLKDSIN